VPTKLRVLVKIFEEAHLRASFPSGTPSFLFRKTLANGEEYVFGATMDLDDRDEIFNGQSSQAILHVIGNLPESDILPGAEWAIYYNRRDIGKMSVIEVLSAETRS
jgi:hypothetical protein